MPNTITRRETLKRGLAASSLLAFLPELPALAQGEMDVPFTDYPANYKSNSNPAAANRFLDIRNIDGQITPNDQFFFIQHYNRPEIDANAYRLKLTGLVNKPMELTVADLKAMKPVELVNGYECSGNSGRFFQGLSSCGRFTGVPLNQVLKRAGVGAAAREVVFFGTDRGKEDVVFRQETFKIEQQFGRSITLEHAMKPEPLLAYALNGQALTRFGKVVIKQAQYKDDAGPIDPECGCPCCRGGYARAYLRHLFLAGEMTVLRLLSVHNLHWYGELVGGARAAIRSGTWPAYKAATLARLEAGQ